MPGSKRLICALATAVVLAAGPAAAKSTSAAPDSQKVVADIQAMFDAAAVGDMAAAKARYTPDAYLFDGGGRYDVDGILSVIRDEKQSGRTYVWKVTNADVHFLCNTAWVAYENEGGSTKNGQVTQTVWLESMVLKAQGGHWLIAFVHSTVARSSPSPYAKALHPFLPSPEAQPGSGAKP